MLRLSKLTDYAVVVLIRLAEGQRGCSEQRVGGEAVQTSPGIAAITGVPEPTVAKVLKALAASSMVASLRGARGGYRLLKPLTAIHLQPSQGGDPKPGADVKVLAAIAVIGVLIVVVAAINFVTLMTARAARRLGSGPAGGAAWLCGPGHRA